MSLALPPTFTLRIRRLDRAFWELAASQILPLPRGEAFLFFEDPRNLFDITPDWLSFIMQERDAKIAMFEGAEFDYRIRWFGVPMRWSSRIEGYRPPGRFTDIQVTGPYRSWSHLHVFEEAGGATLMRDIVTYELPFGVLGRAVHALFVRKQLEDIFRYRAMRIDEWSRGVLRRKRGNAGSGT